MDSWNGGIFSAIFLIWWFWVANAPYFTYHQEGGGEWGDAKWKLCVGNILQIVKWLVKQVNAMHSMDGWLAGSDDQKQPQQQQQRTGQD